MTYLESAGEYSTVLANLLLNNWPQKLVPRTIMPLYTHMHQAQQVLGITFYAQLYCRVYLSQSLINSSKIFTRSSMHQYVQESNATIVPVCACCICVYSGIMVLRCFSASFKSKLVQSNIPPQIPSMSSRIFIRISSDT